MSVIRSLIVRVGTDLTQFEKGMKGVERTLKNMGTSLSRMGKSMTMYVTAPILAAGAAMTKLAMDAIESENLFEVSMGNMADAARDWSEELRDQLGLNSYEVRKNIGTFNVMFTSMGAGTKAAYDMAAGLTELAYDMASFYNLSPEEAFIKLQAGITGETEPLKRLGILVDEATTKTYAYKLGIAEQGKELTQQQKLLARYAAIMGQTSKAQGDLARTMDSPTNKLRIMKSRVTEMGIEIGTKLLPIFEKLLGYVDKAITWFSKLTDKQQDNIIKWALFAAAIGPVLSVLGKLLTGGSKTLKFLGNLGKALKNAGAETSVLSKGMKTLVSWFDKAAIAITGAKVSLLAFAGLAAEVAAMTLLQGSTDPKVTEWNKQKAMEGWTQEQKDSYYKALYSQYSSPEGLEDWENSLLPTVKQKAAAAKILYDTIKEMQEDDPWQEQEEEIDGMTDGMEDFTDSVRSAIDAIRQQTSAFANFSGLFDIFERKHISGNRLMNRLKAQVQAMGEWQNSLVMLQAKGISEQFLQTLRMMGPGAVDEINALAGLSSGQLREYEGLYNQKLGIGATQAGWGIQAQNYVENQINLEITGNQISSEADVERVANSIIAKLRYEGVRI